MMPVNYCLHILRAEQSHITEYYFGCVGTVRYTCRQHLLPQRNSTFYLSQNVVPDIWVTSFLVPDAISYSNWPSLSYRRALRMNYIQCRCFSSLHLFQVLMLQPPVFFQKWIVFSSNYNVLLNQYCYVCSEVQIVIDSFIYQWSI